MNLYQTFQQKEAQPNILYISHFLTNLNYCKQNSKKLIF